MKLRDKILYMLFGAGLVVLGMVLNSLVSGDAEAQSDGFNMNFGYIACRSLTIIDDNGKVRGRFGLNTYKDAMLIIFGNDGKTVVAYLSGNEVYPTNEMMFRLSSKSKTDKRMVMMTLNDKQIEFYRQVGYLVVPNLLTKTEIGTFLRYEAQQNKQQLGYQTHLVDPQWAYLAHHPKVSSCVAQLLASQPMIVQTMYLPKPPLGTREVAHPGLALHQDSLFIRNEPNTLMACWLALDDTGGDNGGLCVVANSHRYGLQPAHHNQDAEEHVSSVQTYGIRDRNGQEWSEELYSFEMDNLEQMDIQHLSVPVGSGVFLPD